VQISHRVTIYGSDLDLLSHPDSCPSEPRRYWQQTVIGRNVRIGSLACICPGVKIGDGAVIGVGAIVRKNVAAGEITQPASQCDLVNHNEDDLTQPEASPCRNDTNRSLKVEKLAAVWPSGRARHPSIIFVASSGRSGSHSIAQWLDCSDDVRGRHESRLQLVKWSTEYAEGVASREKTLARLEDLFLDGTVYDPDLVYVESDQKTYNLLPLLAEVLPQAKFVWLIRAGHAVVSSIVGRGWYARQPSNFQNHNVDWWWENWRVQGGRTNPPVEDWSLMTQFEKCAWYWSHANETIEAAVDELQPDKVLRIRLEDIGDETDRITSFCGVKRHSKRVPISNPARHSKHFHSNWSKDERIAFKRWCGPMMFRIYPDLMRNLGFSSRAHWLLTSNKPAGTNPPSGELS